MNKSMELISVIVLNYNNGELIFETLTSILEQTYPRIEIVISDDCSKFDEDKVRNWIDVNKRNNIENVVINRNPINYGTVKNFEIATGLSRGDLITHIAADDIFYENTTFDTFIRRFHELESAGYKNVCLTGQTELWDVNLSDKIGDFVTEDTKEMLNINDTAYLFEKVSCDCILPAVYLWRKGLKEFIGKLSKEYRLMEDWPTYLRLLRNGIQIHYLDEGLIKHRDGGISHGNKNGTNNIRDAYIKDINTMIRQDILPYSKNFEEESISKILIEYRRTVCNTSGRSTDESQLRNMIVNKIWAQKEAKTPNKAINLIKRCVLLTTYFMTEIYCAICDKQK